MCLFNTGMNLAESLLSKLVIKGSEMLKLRFDDAAKNMSIHATDGNIGKCVDLLFDDRFWTARYLVVKTSNWLFGSDNWLFGREVLIPIVSVERVDIEKNQIELCLTKEQIENAPSIDTDAPVSIQHETSLADYYAYGHYWGFDTAWGAVANPMLLRNTRDKPMATPIHSDVGKPLSSLC